MCSAMFSAFHFFLGVLGRFDSFSSNASQKTPNPGAHGCTQTTWIDMPWILKCRRWLATRRLPGLALRSLESQLVQASPLSLSRCCCNKYDMMADVDGYGLMDAKWCKHHGNRGLGLSTSAKPTAKPRTQQKACCWGLITLPMGDWKTHLEGLDFNHWKFLMQCVWYSV